MGSFSELAKNNDSMGLSDTPYNNSISLPDANNLFNNNAEENSFISSVNMDDSIGMLSNVKPNAFNIVQPIGTLVILLIGIILTIILLVKSIKSRKNIISDISINSINRVKRTSIILLVLSILSCSFITLILSIISIVLSSNAQKVLGENLDESKSKISIASVLNIISIVFLSISFTVLVLTIFLSGMHILNMVNTFNFAI